MTAAFAPDTETALVAAVALVNSGESRDGLTEVADLDHFYATFDYTGSHASSAVELKEVKAIRPFLRELLTAGEDRMVGLINATLVREQAVPQLVRHDAYDWHVHATRSEDALAVRITVEVAMALIDVLRSGERGRVSECAADGCTRLLVDTSKNRSRRFCGVACANRVAAAAYRSRRREGQPIPAAVTD